MKRLLSAVLIFTLSLLCFTCAFAMEVDFDDDFEADLEMEFDMEWPSFENEVTGAEVKELLEALFSSAFKTESDDAFQIDIDKTIIAATLFDKPCEIQCWQSYRGNYVLFITFEEPEEGDVSARASAAQDMTDAVALTYGVYEKAVITVPREDGRHEEKRLEAPQGERIAERAFEKDEVISLLVWWQELFVLIERDAQGITIAYLPPENELDAEYVKRIDTLEAYRFDE